MELPEGLAVGAAERLHRLHLTPAPASDLQYVMYPWAVSTDKLQEAGWEAAHSNEEAFAELLAESTATTRRWHDDSGRKTRPPDLVLLAPLSRWSVRQLWYGARGASAAEEGDDNGFFRYRHRSAARRERGGAHHRGRARRGAFCG